MRLAIGRWLSAATLLLAASSAATGAEPVARPTGPKIPSNLLRLSLLFPEPPSGPVLPRLMLVEESGQPIAEPFLDQELWSPDARMLTVLMHPGRVKTGLVANERLGRALRPGERIALTLDGKILRRWTVGAPDTSAPAPDRWRTSVPQRASREPLIVRLDEPVDALDVDMIAVRAPNGSRVEGRASLSAGEREWRFTPDRPWAAGRYQVVAATDLEDPSGNRPGQSFEHQPGGTADTATGPTFDPR